jgi:hypothetical protein
MGIGTATIVTGSGPKYAGPSGFTRSEQARLIQKNDRFTEPIAPTIDGDKIPMKCPRCHSVAVQEVFVDYGSSSMSFPGYRCVICGDISDATIIRHRAEQSPLVPGNSRRSRIPKLTAGQNAPDSPA